MFGIVETNFLSKNNHCEYIYPQIVDIVEKEKEPYFILIRREDYHFNEAKRSKWEMNRLNYILLKIG